MNIHDYLKKQLNEEQYAAATHIDSSSLILAGAGAWKTRTLTYKIMYLIHHKSITPQRILAVTFTNKAANEMKERLIELSDEFEALDTEKETKADTKEAHNPIQSAEDEDFAAFLGAMKWSPKWPSGSLAPTDLQRVGTFHSIFLKILKQDIEKLAPIYKTTTTPQVTSSTVGLLTPEKAPQREFKWSKSFTIYDPSECQSVIRAIIKDLGIQDHVKPKEAKILISKFKEKALFPIDVLKTAMSDLDEKVGEIYDRYTKALIKANALDFDDLLFLSYHLFKQSPNVLAKWQKKWDYIMVDEAQDTNQVQFDLMRMLSKECNNVTLIGDDYQSIYGRRGAVMENFLNVEKYWSDIVMHKLQINYRSRPHIVAAGSAIINNNSQQYEKELRAHRKWDDTIKVFHYPDEYEEASNTIELIKKIHSDKNAKWWDFAILYRTNSQSQVFEQLFVQEWIPYKIWWWFKFFDRKEIKDIMAYLRFLRNPQDDISLKRIINVPSRKIGKTTIGKIEEYATVENLSLFQAIDMLGTNNMWINGPTTNRILQFSTMIKLWLNVFPTLTPSKLIQRIINDIKYHEYLIDEEGDKNAADEKYENIGQLINLSSKIADTGEPWLDLFLEDVSLMTDLVDDGAGTPDAVMLMTIHASKGLEFPAICIVGAEDGLFPSGRSSLDTRELEEERRLMYVAITRAKDHLFISHAYSRRQWWQMTYNPPSRFLRELPSDIVKEYDLTGNYWWRWSAEANPLQSGDMISHKLFGDGLIVELWSNAAIVKFDNPKYGIRKIPVRMLVRQ